MIIKLNKIKLKQILAVEVGLDEAFYCEFDNYL